MKYTRLDQNIYTRVNQNILLSQFWEWSADKEIRQGYMCLVLVGKGDIALKRCDFEKFEQWEYRKVFKKHHTWHRH